MSMALAVGVDYRKRVEDAVDRLPPFSPVLNKVMATLADEDVSFSRLGAVIENDTVLAGTILRVVNSPLYGRRGTINSVAHALSILGLAKTRNLVLGLGITKRWATARVPKCWSTRQFNLHSLACGVLADQLAIRKDVNYAEGAFAAGLLHDIGRLLMAIAIPQETDELFALAISRKSKLNDLEQEYLGMSHSEVSGFVLERWNLPAPIRLAVRHHHDPERQPVRHFPSLAHIVEEANHIVTALGYTIEPYLNAPSDQLSSVPEAVIQTFHTDFEALRTVI